MSGHIAWFNCQAGVAGDMALAALVDAGADPDGIVSAIAALGPDAHSLTFERVQRCGIGALRTNITLDPPTASGASAPHRPAREIIDLLERSDLPPRVARRATDVFVRLTEVEGTIHGVPPGDVELHEVGALDSIIDVVGVCAALEDLGVDEILYGPIGLGSGTTHGAHGALPNPAPATARMLADASAPTIGLDTSLETATPTGVALMTALGRSGPIPTARLGAVGYGAGSADPAGRANVVQVLVSVTHQPAPVERLTLLETNVDDVTGEVLAHAVATLVGRGARDAWITPIVMKKGRPAYTVSVLCDPTDGDLMREILVTETGTLGVRTTSTDRWAAGRTTDAVVVDGQRIGIKVADHRRKPEFDDAVRAASRLGRPVRDVLDRARALAERSSGTETGTEPAHPDP